MGVLIIAEKPPATSDYDQWKIYKSSSETGTYSLLATQDVTDLTYYDEAGTSSSWYKISYYNSTTANESELSDPIQGQSTTYTTVRKVESFLQMAGLTDSTSPSVQEIVEIINRKEDEIDNTTGHAWRLRYSGTNSGQDTEAKYEYYDIDGTWERQTGIPIYLKHRKIRSLDSTKGDALEYWNGSEWEDWLSNKTEGRGNDYWLDTDEGIIYIRSFYISPKPKAFRIKYRYGEEKVNLEIEDICTKMVAIDILMGMDPRAMIVQEGSPVMSHRERIEKLQEEINNKIQKYIEFRTITSSI